MILLGVTMPSVLGQAALPATSITAESDTPATHDAAGPVLPPTGQHWAGATVIAILGFVFAAAVIGPVVRANRPATDRTADSAPRDE